MLSFHSAAQIAACPSTATDPRLRALLTDRVDQWRATGLLDMTHLLIVEPGDTVADIEAEVAFSPLINPLDASRFGTPDFRPFWDDLRDRGGWFELTMTVGDGGFAFVLFIKDADGADPDLLSLCRAHAAGPSGT